MYLIDISSLKNLNDGLNEFISYCFEYSEKYNEESLKENFSEKLFLDNLANEFETEFVPIIKKSSVLREHLNTIGNKLEEICLDYTHQTQNYRNIIIDDSLINQYEMDSDSKSLFLHLYNTTLDTITFDRYRINKGLETFNEAFGKLKIEVSICPYCNTNFVSNAYSKDHFLPKKDFPLLAIWVENLVISCKECNEGVKSVDYKLPCLHPYFDNIEDFFEFRYSRDSNGEIRLEKNVLKTNIEEIATNNFFDVFKIIERYSNTVLEEAVSNMNDIRREIEDNCEMFNVEKKEDIKRIFETKIHNAILKYQSEKKTRRNTKIFIDFLNQLSEEIDSEVDFLLFKKNLKNRVISTSNTSHM